MMKAQTTTAQSEAVQARTTDGKADRAGAARSHSLHRGGKPLPDKYRFLLFDDKREVELVWNGKTNAVTNVVLPFQTIEQVDEPRAEKPRTRRCRKTCSPWTTVAANFKGWTNKLIWGDNKLILSSLKNGPMREEIEKQGGLKLIYIDPPFDVGADFSMNIEIGNGIFTKERMCWKNWPIAIPGARAMIPSL